MKLGLCDDDINFLRNLKDTLYSVFRDLNREITIFTFSSGELFLNYYQEVKDFNIIFLDIKMKGINGLQVAEKVRETDSNMQIFFLTSFKNYVFKGYTVKAVNYLLKPITYNKLKFELENALINIKEINDRYIVEKNDIGVFKIYFDEIIYIETYQRNTIIHTCKSDILSYKNMKQHLFILKEYNFYRIHESYIINLAYIKSIKKFDIELSSNIILKISKYRKKMFLESLSKYYGTII